MTICAECQHRFWKTCCHHGGGYFCRATPEPPNLVTGYVAYTWCSSVNTKGSCSKFKPKSPGLFARIWQRIRKQPAPASKTYSREEQEAFHPKGPGSSF